MEIYSSKLWLSDLDEIISILPELEDLDGNTILITGATGLICSAIIDVLIRYNDTHKGKIKTLAAGRNFEKTRNRFLPYFGKDYFQFVQYDAVSTSNELKLHCDYIIHGSSNAFSESIFKEPVETMLGNFVGVKYLLDYSKECGCKRLLFISSSEVYGKKEGNEPYEENEYGYVDLLNSRNSYSVGKRAAETLCASYADEYGVESVIVRPGHIYGPTASHNDSRVSSAWAYSAAKGEDIVMKSDGSSLRSYCYCLDCASAILKVLIKGENIHAYNISNPDSIITIKQMAELLTKFADVEMKIKLPMEEEKKSFNPMSNSSLDSVSLQKLGWKGLFNAEKGAAHTVEILKEIMGRA